MCFREARGQFKECESAFGFPFSEMKIVVSNDLNEALITALNDEVGGVIRAECQITPVYFLCIF